MRLKHPVAMLSSCGLAAALLAPVAGAANIVAGNLQYSISPPPTTAGSWGPASDLSASATVADQLYQDWWWLRVGSESRESTLYSPSGAGFNQPGSDTLTFVTQQSGLQLSASWVVVSGPAGTGELRATLTITNPGNSTVTVRAFHYADIDVNGTWTDDVVQQISPTLYQFADATGSTGEHPYIVRYGASAGAQFGLGENGSMIDSLTNSGKTTLNGSLGGYGGGPSDLAGAWQWTLSLQAGATTQVTAFVSLVPAPAGLGVFALCGLLLMPRARRAQR